MKKSTKAWMIAGISLAVAGSAAFVGAMAMLNWDFSKLSNIKYETNTYTVDQSFENLSVNVKTDNLSFALAEDGKCSVVCHEQEKMKHTVEVNQNTLEINVNDTREWYEHIGFFSFDSPKTTVYLPKERFASLTIDASTGDIDIPKVFGFDSIGIYGSTGNVNCAASSKGLTQIKRSTGNILVNGASSGELKLTTSTGNICLESVSAEGDITISVSTGQSTLSDVTCKNLTTDGSTGEVFLKNVIASQAFSIDRSTGDVAFDRCDAAEILVKTSTGDVTGSLLSEKVFITDTSTGDIRVPPTTTGGKCTIKTGTGDIRIDIPSLR